MLKYLISEIKTSPAAFIKCLPRIILILVEIGVAWLTYILFYIVLQPLRLYNGQWFWRIEGSAYQIMIAIVSTWVDGAGTTIFESGDDITKLTDDNALFIANHQSPIDILVLIRCLQGKNNIIKDVMWIMSWIFQFFAFGTVCKGHKDAFILMGDHAKMAASLLGTDVEKIKADQLANLKNSFRNDFVPLRRKWLIIYPEGGFLKNVRSGSRRFAAKNNLPFLKNVAYPKVVGIQSAIEVMGVKCSRKNGISSDLSQHDARFKWMIDATIGYKEKPSLLNFIVGHRGSHDVFVHYRVYPAGDVIDNENRADENSRISGWMFERFREKDELLDRFYESGTFPNARRTLEPIDYKLVGAFYAFAFLTLGTILYNLVSLLYNDAAA